jgi:AcrR family transcriptional regulator
MSGRRAAAQGGESRRAAPAREPLSRESILTAAMQLAEAEGATQLSLSRLGRAMGVDATAVYRHFRDKDELMLALGDLLIQEAVSAIRPRRTWRTTLRHIALLLRETSLSRPALAQQIAARFTGGESEVALRDHVLAALREAGLTGVATGRYCRAFVEMIFGHIALTATLLTLPEDSQRRDVVIGLQLYGKQGSSARAGIVSQLDARKDEDAVFEVILNNFIEGVDRAAQK